MIEELIGKAVLEVVKPLLEQFVKQLSVPASTPAESFLTIDEAAALTQYDRRTVTKWVKEGKYNAAGKRVFLPVSQFAIGEYRIRRSDLDAFGQGIGSSISSTAPAKPAKAAKPVSITPQEARMRAA